MSLIRRVSLLMLLVVVLALVGGVVTTLIAARDTLQAQLNVKNRDNAQALALALSQQRGDAALMELVLAAQFDTGHYRRIEWTGTDGRSLFRREAEAQCDQGARVVRALAAGSLRAGRGPAVRRLAGDRPVAAREPVGLRARRVVARRRARGGAAGLGGRARRSAGGLGSALDPAPARCGGGAGRRAAARPVRHRGRTERRGVEAAGAQHEHDGGPPEHDVRCAGQAGRGVAPAGADRCGDGRVQSRGSSCSRHSNASNRRRASRRA